MKYYAVQIEVLTKITNQHDRQYQNRFLKITLDSQH